MKKITDLLDIQHPIVMAPMLGVTSPLMVAEASNAGILGSLPVGGLSPERTEELIRETKKLADRPGGYKRDFGIPDQRDERIVVVN